MNQTEKQALDLINDDYEVLYHFLRFFYRIEEMEEDGIRCFPKQELINKDWLANDVWHEIACSVTGLKSKIFYNIVANVIEWAATDDSWRIIYRIFQSSVRPELCWIRVHQVDGDLKGLCAYATVLKATQPDYYQFVGFELV